MPNKKLGLALGLLLALGLVVVLVGALISRHSGQGTFEDANTHVEETDAHAAVRKAVLRTDPTNRPADFDWTNAEMGERKVDGLPVKSPFVTPPYDLSNPDLGVAVHDYVLVGRVERRAGTRHPDSQLRPQTDYDVTVLEVIKGNIDAGQEIPITKDGGISKDRSHVKFSYKNDFMLEAGGVYVFLVGVSSDGKELSVMSPFGTVPLEDDIAAELKRTKRPIGPDEQKAVSKILEKSEVFARYVAAAENKDAAAKLPPEIRDRKRYKSVYEK